MVQREVRLQLVGDVQDRCSVSARPWSRSFTACICFLRFGPGARARRGRPAPRASEESRLDERRVGGLADERPVTSSGVWRGSVTWKGSPDSGAAPAPADGGRGLPQRGQNAASSSLWNRASPGCVSCRASRPRRPRGKAGLPRRPRTTGRSSRRPAGRSDRPKQTVEHIRVPDRAREVVRDTAEVWSSRFWRASSAERLRACARFRRAAETRATDVKARIAPPKP